MKRVPPPPGLQRQVDDLHNVAVQIFGRRDLTQDVLEQVDCQLEEHGLEIVIYNLKNEDEFVWAIVRR